ncbi:hypothetical protein [Neobacillus kokaensis]|uniref:Rad50/SbcC-type AAA domain-containing protein n=1 Tax=Neobacillus kokaensis TaxID=2759023 RepID=A0ABQ3NAN6_9BACI|nr:hypothetical protein [Neobacillus kokaensis]GHH99821.1 hypothetical protein AM1BK_33640 [Neobacillus kokaensis]
MSIDLLTKLEEEKDQWIYKAIDRFDEGFLRFDGQKFKKDEVLVGVYGPTQVGKTTLILTMLGIGDEKIAHLSKALRGKRQKGNSSTITSFIYKRSEDENFYLIFPDKTRICCSSLDELETEISMIRQQIEEGEVSFDKPIILWIARQYFTNRRFAEKSRSISIIDLPGDDTKEKKEEKYVNHILTTYMPYCSVCLVMEISSKVVRLFQLDQPTVRDWMYYPQNFRLVITRCLQSTSVKNAIESGEIATLEDFRANYLHHVNRNDIEIPNQIYPLECGDSWLELKQRNSTVYQKAKAWIDHLFIELLNDLLNVKTPENQIMRIKNMQHSIYRQKSVDLEQIDKDIDQIKESLEEAGQSYSNLTMASQYLLEELGHYEELITDLDKIQLEKFRCRLYTKFEFDPKKDQVVFKDRKTTRLIESFNEVEWEMEEFYKKQLGERARKLKQILREIISSAKFDFQTEPQVKALSLNHIGGLDQYLVFKHFEEDYKIVLDTLNENNTLVYEYYNNQLRHFKLFVKAELMRLCGVKEQHKRMTLEKIKEKQDQKIQQEMSLAKLEEKKTRAQWEWNHDLERPRMLDEILKEEFVKAVSVWQEKLFAKQTTDVERWVYHQYCQIISKQAERIIGNEYF